MKNFALAFVAAASVVGCADFTVRSVDATLHVSEKNYTLGKEQVAHVGQPIIRVKVYDARAYPSFTSGSGFSASGLNGLGAAYPIGALVLVVAFLDYDGVAYSAVMLDPPLPGNALMLLDSAGRYGGLAFFQSEVFDLCDEELPGCVTPGTIDFTPSETRAEQVIPDRAFINFEIIYSGATKDTVYLLYREYTPASLIRPAFTQNLTYDRASSTIRFRDVVIHVTEASNESLRYVVEQDGLIPDAP